MRSAMFGLSCLMITIMSILIVSVMVSYDNRQVNLEKHLQDAVKSAMNEVFLAETPTIVSEDDIAGYVLDSLALAITSCDFLQVDVVDSDLANGMISVRATVSYTSISADDSGQMTSDTVDFVSQTTVIMDIIENALPDNYIVSYKLEEGASTNYKQYIKTSGDMVPVPVNPTKDGFSFTGWSYEGNYMDESDISSMSLLSDVTFVAIWN